MRSSSPPDSVGRWCTNRPSAVLGRGSWCTNRPFARSRTGSDHHEREAVATSLAGGCPGGDNRRQRHGAGRPDGGPADPPERHSRVRHRGSGRSVGPQRELADVGGIPRLRRPARGRARPSACVRDGLDPVCGGVRLCRPQPDVRRAACLSRPAGPGGSPHAAHLGRHRQPRLFGSGARWGPGHDGWRGGGRRGPGACHRRGTHLAPGLAIGPPCQRPAGRACGRGRTLLGSA